MILSEYEKDGIPSLTSKGGKRWYQAPIACRVITAGETEDQLCKSTVFNFWTLHKEDWKYIVRNYCPLHICLWWTRWKRPARNTILRNKKTIELIKIPKVIIVKNKFQIVDIFLKIWIYANYILHSLTEISLKCWKSQRTTRADVVS